MLELIHFNQNEFIEGDNLQERVGLRGRNMLELAQLKTPIAPGFIIESANLKAVLSDKFDRSDLEAAVKKIEELTDKTFNSPERPLLFKVVVSPSIQIGSISSVHTLGISDAVAEGFAAFCGEEFSYGEYHHYLENFSTRFLGKSKQDFKAIEEANPNASKKEICALYREKVVPEFPQEGYEQLQMVLKAMAGKYLEDPMNEGIEAGLMVQMMVYGNFGEKSYNGQFYSRDIVTGAPKLSGFYGHNEFDTDPENGKDINDIDKEYSEQLGKISRLLEEKFLDIRHIKFVIEESRIWMVEQNPVDAKSTQAEVRTLLDLNSKNLVTDQKMIISVPPGQLQDLLHPIINHDTTKEMPKVVGGIAGSPGASVGRVAFSAKVLLSEYKRCALSGLDLHLILIMAHTDAEDVEAIELGTAVIASEGGYASHAPVVSRSLRKPCLLYENIEYHDGYILMDGKRINELDTISMEVPTYTDPTVWLGKADLVPPDTSENGLEDFVKAVAKVEGNINVFGIAHNINDIKMSLRLGAEGIGQFPVDDLLKRPNSLKCFREAILLSDPALRKAALGDLEKLLEKDVLEIINLLEGKKIIFMLMNNPLQEFLPHSPEEQQQVYGELARKHTNITSEEFKIRAGQLRNINPMMGLRGSRIAISYPDLYETQVSAIFKAASAYSDNGKNNLQLELMVPAVMGDAEMRFIRHGRNIESTIIPGIHTVDKNLASNNGAKLPFNYKVGAVIELPAAALMAGHISKQSDFFSIDINMLTQTTTGMSADDINLFLPSYTQYDILKDNPFQILSLPVKELIATTVHFGKLTRPDLTIGICGAHASDPANVNFAIQEKLNFITCAPLGVPIAKLAVAQQALEKDN